MMVLAVWEGGGGGGGGVRGDLMPQGDGVLGGWGGIGFGDGV